MHFPTRTYIPLVALLALAAAPAEALAQGGTGSPPAGGGETAQVVIGTIASTLVVAVMLGLVMAHRQGKVALVDRLGEVSGRLLGLPGWAALPLAVLGGSLITAVFGMYWDIATHIDAGRDEGPFANASHYFILVGLFGIFFAGLLAVSMPKERPGQAAVRLAKGWYAPLGGLLILVCAAFALSGFPLDDVWHRIFGQDVTLWGPTHLLLFGGASLSTLGALILLVEGNRAQGAVAEEKRVRLRVLQALLCGAFLIGLSTFQGEFDFAVPQFRLVWHPILLMLAAGVALLTARVYFGRGGALFAALFFILVRGTLTLLVSPGFGHTLLHFPLYLVEALVVEAVAVRVPRDRPITLGAIAGALIGTLGLAAEWGWSHVWWTIEWPSSLFPEAAIAGFVTAVAGGVVGGFIGRALISGEVSPQPVPKALLPAALAALVAVLVYAAPISEGDPIRAQVTLREVDPAPERTVHATVRLDPRDAADDGLRWFNGTAWQGGEGRSVVGDLEEVSPGVWRTTKPIPVYGTWKSTLRLHKDSAVLGLPVFMPADEAIPVREIPARGGFTREFVEDEELLQREQKDDVSGGLVAFAYITVLLIGLGLYGSMGWGLHRLQLSLSRAPAARTAQKGSN
jgi:hypothetical protein